MTYEIQEFTNEQFGTIRTIMQDEEPWFIAIDICNALEISNNRMAISRLDEDEKMTVSLTDSHSGQRGGAQSITVVNEPGLYALVLGSRKPEAKQFKRWITHEVIPSIRKHGGYVLNQENMSSEEFLARALLFAGSVIDEKNEQIQELQEDVERMLPKAEFFDAVTDSKDAIEMGKVAKLLDYPGIGRNKLFEILRQNGVLRHNNEPYQQYIDRGYFRTVEQKFATEDGETRIYIKTLVFQKGVDFIRRLLERMYVEISECSCMDGGLCE